MQAKKSDFVWYELLTTDLDAATKFYCDVVGWAPREITGPGMRYTVLGMNPQTRGVAGLMQMPEHLTSAAATPFWVGYISAEDVDAAAAEATAAGATIHREPTDIPHVGRFAVVADPQGAIFHLFKPTPQAEVPPALAPDADGIVGWHELMTTDSLAAWTFYASQFGWTISEEYDMGPAGVYRTFSSNDQGMTGGMMTIPDSLRAQMPRPDWNFYFTVPNIREAKTRIEAAGGVILHGPVQVPGGSWIVNGLDPQGGRFSLLSKKG